MIEKCERLTCLDYCKKEENNCRMHDDVSVCGDAITTIAKSSSSASSYSKPQETNVNVINKNLGRGLASLGICILGGFCMWVTNGATGIGWSILGLLIIWG